MADRNSGRPPVDAFHRVDDPAQARMLMREDVLRFFRPFLAREATVTDAAREAGCPPSVMLYRVRTFVGAGLLRVVREVPRAGRAIKVYRSTHDAYFVPYALTPYATLEEAFLAAHEAAARRIARLNARRFARRGWDGYRLYRNADGEAWTEGAPDAAAMVELDDPERPVGIDYITDLHLTRDEARSLQDTLVRVLRDHAPREGRADTAPYAFSVALVPIEGEEPS